jgi:hypothetical protein
MEIDARKIFENTPGAADVAVDAAAGTATLRFQFPGNIDAMVGKLRNRGLIASTTIGLTVPVENLSGRTIDPTEFLADLNHSPTISGASFDGKTVSVTILAATNALRFLYEEIIVNGLMPLDMPTVAGPQEFVL